MGQLSRQRRRSAQKFATGLLLGLSLLFILGAASGNIRWTQLRDGDRHGTGVYGQSSDGTGTAGHCAKFSADGSLTEGGACISKYTTSWTSQTSVTVTHNLGTTAVIVQVYDGSGVLVAPESITATSTNVVTLTFGAAFTGSVVVLG